MNKIMHNKLELNINLDIVRIFAAFMVLSVHIGQIVGFDFSIGAKGVPIFFVLSGYLGFKSYDKVLSVKAYIKKRFIRIVPTYYISLVIVYFFDLYKYSKTMSLEEILVKGPCGIRFFRFFFFLQTIIPTDNWQLWGNRNATWSMSSFVFFYLIVPILYKLINKFWKMIGIIGGLAFLKPYVISFLIKYLSFYPMEASIEYFVGSSPLITLISFLFGACIFFAEKEKKEGIYIVLSCLCLFMSNFSFYQFELLTVIFILTTLHTKMLVNHSRVKNLIPIFSKGSFCLYLLHPILLQIGKELWINWGRCSNKVVYLLFLYLFSMGCSYVFYWKILRKFENYLRKG